MQKEKEEINLICESKYTYVFFCLYFRVFILYTFNILLRATQPNWFCIDCWKKWLAKVGRRSTIFITYSILFRRGVFQEVPWFILAACRLHILVAFGILLGTFSIDLIQNYVLSAPEAQSTADNSKKQYAILALILNELGRRFWLRFVRRLI